MMSAMSLSLKGSQSIWETRVADGPFRLLLISVSLWLRGLVGSCGSGTGVYKWYRVVCTEVLGNLGLVVGRLVGGGWVWVGGWVGVRVLVQGGRGLDYAFEKVCLLKSCAILEALTSFLKLFLGAKNVCVLVYSTCAKLVGMQLQVPQKLEKLGMSCTLR